ncbi:MAG: hypothetical protein IIW17_09430 [Clostridia bacterium]|nr:hypothetical protein [Clostridia bacterium]MBQ5794226.1 hypothetical protein [Clostridia bacterium]
MIEQKSAPKKQKVGSLFFHLFNRLSLGLYHLLINCIVGRALTSYDVLEQRWNTICTRIFGAPDGRLRQRLHKLRLYCAYMIEHSLILRVFDRLIKFLIQLPMNVFGSFLFAYGAVSAAVYFVADRLYELYQGNIGWGICGIVLALSSVPLLCTGKSLYRAAFGSRIVGRILRSYLGLEQRQQKTEKERANTFMVYISLILGVFMGLLAIFIHPATVPIMALLIILVITVAYIPESGVLLMAATVGLWWLTDFPVLCAVSIAVITLLSYVNKLLLGRRVLHVHLLDFVLLLVAAVIALNGLLTSSGVISTAYGVGYAVLIAMYFPTVNLMRSREWLERCYKLLAFSGAVLAFAGVLPMAQILYLLDISMRHVDLSMFAQLFERYEAYFGQGTMVGGMLVLFVPLILSRFVKKRTIIGFFWKFAVLLAACITLTLSMQLGIWVGFAVMLAIFFFTYSYRSMSAAMLIAFPVTCGVVWHRELNYMFRIENSAIVRSASAVLSDYVDSIAQQKLMGQGVLQMVSQHCLGVGFGNHAVYGTLVHYLAPELRHVTDVGNTYLQLLAECGYLGMLLLLAAMLIFIIGVLTYMRWGEHQTTKASVAAGLAGVFGVLVTGAFCNLMNNASLFGLFWLVIGLTIASLRTQYSVHARAVQTHVGNAECSDIAFRTR